MLTSQTSTLGPEVEPTILHSAHQSPMADNEPSLSSIPSPVSSDREAEIIEQFRLHRELEGHNLNDNPPDDENEVRRRISYTREQKLVAISYATTTWKQGKDGNPKLISKYAAAANLGITTAMLRKWIQTKARIESLPKGKRKESGGGPCQEPELEERLLQLFKESRLAGRKTNKPWFVREGKRLYGEMYPHRVTKVPGKMAEYSGFKFSDGWFEGFRRRAGVTSRNLTKRAEQVKFQFHRNENFH
jgi:hypothetical protein